MVEDLQTSARTDFGSFVRSYERVVDPLTLPVGLFALELCRVSSDSQVIDVAAGTGALALEAARRGARVLATDISPEMVRRASERLEPFASCEASVMGFDALEVAGASFDVALSIMGVLAFANGERGLLELTRVTRPGGCIAVATWDSEHKAAPHYLAYEVFAEVFPGRQLWPDSFFPNWPKVDVVSALRKVGCQQVDLHGYEGVWTLTSPSNVMTESRFSISQFPGYKSLTDQDKDSFAEAFTKRIVRCADPSGVARIPTRAFVATGRLPGKRSVAQKNETRA